MPTKSMSAIPFTSHPTSRLLRVVLTSLLALAATLATCGEAVAESKQRLYRCGTSHHRGELALATHAYFRNRVSHQAQRGPVSQLGQSGNIVLIEGDPSLIQPANPFDLHQQTLVFEPSSTGSYSATRTTSQLDLSLGRKRNLQDDGSLELQLPFPFPFFGRERNRLYLNANGNLTFQPEEEFAYPGTDNLLDGPPRIAVLYTDLDPSAGGTIRVAEQPDRVVVTWDSVPEWNVRNQNTFQVELEPTGRITFRYRDRIDTQVGIVGLATGETGSSFRILDFTTPIQLQRYTFFERFFADPVVDEVATIKRFYRELPDAFDAIVLWTDFTSDLDDAFAYRVPISNDVRGIGLNSYDRGRFWGSSGQLKGVLFMGNLERYPQSPDQPVWREGPTTLGILAHEVAHRWLAYVEIRDGNTPDILLDSSNFHWSFFLDSDASFIYGNDFAQEGDRRFRSVDIRSHFSMLDLYLMGLAGADEVAPFFYIADGSGTTYYGAPFTRDSFPERGAVVRGTKRNVLIDAIIGAEGPRVPDVASAPRHFNHAWVILSRANHPTSPENIGRIDAIRAAFEGYFQQKTLGRGTISSTISQ